MYRLRCTGLINAVCGTWVMRATLALSGASCHYWQRQDCLVVALLHILFIAFSFYSSFFFSHSLRSIARTFGRVAAYHYRVNSCFWRHSYKHKLEPPLLAPFGLLAPSAPFAISSVLLVFIELSGDVL